MKKLRGVAGVAYYYFADVWKSVMVKLPDNILKRMWPCAPWLSLDLLKLALLVRRTVLEDNKECRSIF